MKGRVVVLIDVDVGRKFDKTNSQNLSLIGVRSGALRVLTEIYRDKLDCSNFWGWKFFSDSRQIAQNAGSNLFMDFSPRTFSKFSDQLEQHSSAAQKQSRRTHAGTGSCRSMLVKALTDVVTNYPWDMPDIASPVRRPRKKAGREKAAKAANVIFVFSESPVTCSAWARFHGVSKPSMAVDVERLAQETLLPPSLMEYLERYNIDLVFVDVAPPKLQDAEVDVCHGLCQRFAQCVADLATRVSATTLSDLLYRSGHGCGSGGAAAAGLPARWTATTMSCVGAGAAAAAAPTAAVPCSSGNGQPPAVCSLQYEDSSICRLLLTSYLTDSAGSPQPDDIVDIRILGLVRQSHIALTPMDTLACFGVTSEWLLSTAFQKLMKLLCATGLSLAVSLYVADDDRCLLGILLPYSSSIALVRLCDTDGLDGATCSAVEPRPVPVSRASFNRGSPATGHGGASARNATERALRASSLVGDASVTGADGNASSSGSGAQVSPLRAKQDRLRFGAAASESSSQTTTSALVTRSESTAAAADRSAAVCRSATTATTPTRRSPRKRVLRSSPGQQRHRQQGTPSSSAASTPQQQQSGGSSKRRGRGRQPQSVGTPPEQLTTPSKKRRKSSVHAASAAGLVVADGASPACGEVDPVAFEFSPSLAKAVGTDVVSRFVDMADRHCHLFALDPDSGNVDVNMFSAMSVFSSWTNAFPSAVDNGADAGLRPVLLGLRSDSSDRLVESDANANLHDLYKSMAGTSRSPRGSSSGASMPGQSPNSNAAARGNVIGSSGANRTTAVLSVQDLTSQGVVDLPLQKGIRKWMTSWVTSFTAEDATEDEDSYGSMVERLTEQQAWYSPKQLREFLSDSDSAQRCSWLQAQIFLRFELLARHASALNDKVTNELISFLSSMGVSFGPRSLVTFLAGVLVESYAETHKDLLVDLYEELDVMPCEALGAEPVAMDTFPSLMSTAAVDLMGADVKAEDAGKPSLKRHPTEDMSRRQIAVPTRKRSRKKSTGSSKIVQADMDLSKRIRGSSDSSVQTSSQPDGVKGKEGVRRQLFSAAADGKSASASSSVFPPLKSALKTSSRPADSGTNSASLSPLRSSTSLLFDSGASVPAGHAAPSGGLARAGVSVTIDEETLVDESPVKRARRQLHGSGDSHAVFSVQDTPVKDATTDKQRTMELRRRLSKGKVSIAETPPRKSFYSTSDTRRSRGFIRRSHTISHLLSATTTTDSDAEMADSSQAVATSSVLGAALLDSSSISLSSLQDPFSPSAVKRKHSSHDDGGDNEDGNARSVDSARRKARLPRCKSDGGPRPRAPSRSHRRQHRSPASPELISESVLSEADDDDVVGNSPENAADFPGAANVADGSLLSLPDAPQIEGIDRLLTSPLVSTSGGGRTVRGFF